MSERTVVSSGTFKSRTESAFKIFQSTRCHTRPEQTSSRASCPRLTPEVGEWTRHLKAIVDVLEFLELLPVAETGSQVAPDLGGPFRTQPAHDEGCQVRVDLCAPYLMASYRVTSSASSARNILKAFTVRLLTVPRGMPVRSDISL